MGIMDTLAAVSNPEPKQDGIAVSMAQGPQYELCNGGWHDMATKKFGCLAFQIVESFTHLLNEERDGIITDSTRDADGGIGGPAAASDLLFHVIARQAVPAQDGASVRKWYRGYSQSDGRWVKFSDGSAIHWQFSHDAQQRSRQSAVMAAFLWYRDVQDQNSQPLAAMCMPGVGLLAIEQHMAQAVAELER